MSRTDLAVLSLLTAACASAVAFGQGTPATQPVARVVTVPPGFLSIQAGKFRILCAPADESVARAAVARLVPTTRPATMAVDLLGRLSERRAALTKTIVTDLALTDAAPVAKLFDETLLPVTRRMEALDHRSPLVYILTSKTNLTTLVKNGTWSDPALYYNRAADGVAFDSALNINPNADIPDALVPVLYQDTDDAEARTNLCAQLMQRSDDDLTRYVGTSTMLAVYLSFVQFVGEQVVRPLKLQPDQDWLGMGLTANFAAKYAAEVTNIPRDQVLNATTTPAPNAPIRAVTVDLLHPTPLQDLNPQYARAYLDAAGQKSTAIVRYWIEKASDESATKLIVSLRASLPADGQALLTRVKDLSGVDLTNALGPQ